MARTLVLTRDPQPGGRIGKRCERRALIRSPSFYQREFRSRSMRLEPKNTGSIECVKPLPEDRVPSFFHDKPTPAKKTAASRYLSGRSSAISQLKEKGRSDIYTVEYTLASAAGPATLL